MRSTERDAALAVAVTAGALVVLAMLSPALLQDPDTAWHVVVGEEILRTGSLPRTDTLSWSRAGTPWIAKEWLAQVVYALAHRAGGWSTAALVAAFFIAVAFGAMAWFLSQRLGRALVVLVCATSFAVAAPHLIARPHVLVLPLLVVWTGILVEATEERRPPPWWLAAVAAVWANLHGSYLLALALLAGLMVDALVTAPSGERRRTAATWGPVVLASTLATFATPYGVGTWVAALDVLRLGAARDVITEWRPADLRSPGPFGVVLVVGLSWAAAVRLRPRWTRALVVAGVLGLGLLAVRNADVVAFTVPLLLAPVVAERLPERWRPATVLRPGIAALVVLALVPALVVASGRAVVPAPSFRPAAAVQVLDGVGCVFNDYGFGGYLIEVGVPTYVDGRTELFGAEHVVEHDEAVRAAPPEALGRLLDDPRIGATLLQPGAPAVTLLDAFPDWERVYTDELAVVHVRRGGAGPC